MNEPMPEFGMWDANGAPIALQRLRVSVAIGGVLAQTRVAQHYRNAGPQNLEIAYTFPLPTGAVLLGFEVKLGERAFVGRVLARPAAETAYEEAIGQGDAAFRLQQIRDGIYSVSLGNLAAGESAEIVLRFAQVLSFHQGRLRYRLPCTLAPRYGDPSGMEPWQRPEIALGAEYPLEIEVTVSGDWAKAAFECPTHAVGGTLVEGGLRLSSRGASLDRDFVLDLRSEQFSSAALGVQIGDVWRIGAFVVPPIMQGEATKGRSYVMLIDCSGSMQGDSLSQAIEGAALALDTLAANDRFALIAFGDQIQCFDAELQPANRKNLGLAKSWLQGLGNLGGTDINLALATALKHAGGSPDCPLDILLLTDGECWQIDDTIADACKKGVRVFCVGVGSAAAEDTLQAISARTDGAVELVTPNEEMAERIAAHFFRMRQPRLRDIRADAGRPAEWSEGPRQASFSGDLVPLYLELPPGSKRPEAVEINLRLDAGPPIAMTLPVQLANGIEEALWRVAAAARLEGLEDPESRLAWALRHELVDADTDYLVIAVRDPQDKACGLPTLQVVPQMLAAGWGATGSVMHAHAQFDFDFPAVVRMPAERYDVPAMTREVGSGLPDYHIPDFLKVDENHSPERFLQELERTAMGLFRRRLPRSLLDLPCGFLPQAILIGLRDLANSGWSEAEIVIELLLCLRDAGLEMPGRLGKALDKLPPRPESSPELQALIDGVLWESNEWTRPQDSVEWDMPAGT